jgi:hypothetical protein
MREMPLTASPAQMLQNPRRDLALRDTKALVQYRGLFNYRCLDSRNAFLTLIRSGYG